jgi:hypothetical protein
LSASVAHAQSGRQENAIWIRDSAKVALLWSDAYGDHQSTSRQNIVDTAKCERARTSARSDVGVTYVWLHSGMLSTMKALVTSYGYSYHCGFIAGGDHSSGSYHYSGTAKDVGSINGRGVSYSNPYWRSYNQRCRDRGAIEVLGPGYPGHDTHVHNAWPRGTSASSPGGCVDTVKRPTNLRAKALGQQRIELKWSDNSNNENHFEIQKSGNSNNGPWNHEKTTGNNVEEYTVNDLTPGKKYWFRVRAYNGEDKSEWSNVDNATTIDSPPGAPIDLVAIATNDDKISLTWTDKANNENGFKIFRSTDGTTFSKIDEIGINRESYNDTDLRGNRKYWYKVCSWNTWGNSDFSNKASDTTPPNAPTGLSAVKGATWDSAKLTWTDNAGAEVGFKIERGTSSTGPWTQIATNAASDTSYTDVGLAGTTQYFYRVRCYNANGNSMYSNTDSVTTGNAPPVLSSIGNKTIAVGQNLTFTAVATDPNQTVNTVNVSGFQTYSVPTTDGTVMFRAPKHSATTSAFIDMAPTNYTKVVSSQPSGNGSTKALKGQWTFKTGQSNPWLRLTTVNAQNLPNPVIDLSHTLRFKIYSSKAIRVGLGVRETTNNPAIGDDGGTTGAIEWVGVTNVAGSSPMPSKTVPANTWTTLNFNCQKNGAWPFSGGDGSVSTGRGVLEHLAIVPDGTSGAFTIHVDDFDVLYNNTLDFTLDAGAPAGALIRKKSGEFTWTPTSAQVGNHRITVRVTDQLGTSDFQTITVTVTSATGNNPPVLSSIGNKTAKEGTALTFTATASDPDAGQTKTFSLDAGAPAGASINGSSGAFTWTPSESQGGGSYPITVRVTDNGSPAASDAETITVIADEVNSSPVLATIADQTANEMQVFSFTPNVTDSDLPAQTRTYALLVRPQGMTINTNTGVISWTPSEADGPETNQVTIRVTDSGSPRLFAERTFNVIVNEVNTAPVLTVATAVLGGTPFGHFEDFADGTFNGTVMFRQPSFSSTTTAFIDASPNLTTVTDTFPEGVPGGKVMKANFSFKTGTTNPWLRLTTFNTTAGNALPNPTIDFGKKLRFDVWTDKPVKLALGVRETGTSAAIGADGGTSGTLEWIGATATGSSPNPSRTISETNWTSVEFDLASETVTAFPGSGNGTLASGKGVLDHLAIVPNGGMGQYTVYLDNFQVLSLTTNMVVDTGKTIVLTNSATDSDLPTQGLEFTLEPGAPTNAIIDSKSGTLEWTPTPAQSPSTNVIGIRVTDDGVPALSDVKTVTIRVNKINTKPRLVDYLSEFFVVPGELVEYEARATDEDSPADTLTYSFVGTPPSGATLDSVTGDFAWTPTTANGTNYVTIRVTDSGTPALYDELTLVIVVSPANSEPTLMLSTARVSEPVVTFQTFTNNTPNGTVMFRQPSFSPSTTNYLGTQTNYTRVTNSIPAGNPNTGGKVLVAQWNFKTGTTGYWLRLTTASAVNVPNPTIDLGAKVKFDIYTTKSLKVGLGIRETGTAAEIGGNGGTTGGIEWVGVPSKTGTSPNPSRSVSANTWTTLEFDLPTEACVDFSGGNGVLATGKGVLEHIALVGNGGTGTYTVYVDNFEVVTTTTLPGTVMMKSSSSLSFTASGSDPETTALIYGLELGAPVEATIGSTSGAFSWTPSVTYDGTTNEITVYVEDSPAGATQTKRDSETLTVIVSADSIGAQAASDVGSIGAGESATIEWNAVPGAVYQVQCKSGVDDAWSDVGEPITAAGPVESVVLDNTNSAKLYRVVEVTASAGE